MSQYDPEPEDDGTYETVFDPDPEDYDYESEDY